jgi:hypothetical protein
METMEESGGDFLYMLRHLAWRLVQVVVVSAAMIWVVVQFGPRGDTKEQAYLAAMKSDLRRLAVAQETYFAEREEYGSLEQLGGIGYRSSPGVTVTLGQLTRTGWSATAAHAGTKYRCGAFAGEVPPPRPEAAVGMPICWKP